MLRFCASPVAIHGTDNVESVEVVRNRLEADASGAIRAVPTDERETIPCGIVLRSVGYRGVPLAGVPFDQSRGVIPNDRGRVEGAERTYVAGWIKRGPSGVIGTNKKDATETVALLLEDARAGWLARETDETFERLLTDRGVDFVEYSGWETIDATERNAGEPLGRPRVKLVTWDELLDAGRGAAAAAPR